MPLLVRGIVRAAILAGCPDPYIVLVNQPVVELLRGDNEEREVLGIVSEVNQHGEVITLAKVAEDGTVFLDGPLPIGVLR